MADDQQASRREFLRGRSALRALLDRAGQFVDQTTGALRGTGRVDASSPRAAELATVARQAMATEFAIDVPAAAGPAAIAAARAALDVVARVEDQLTVYRDWSEVIDLNQNAALRPVSVDEELFRLLRLCEWMFHATHGAFDPTSGPLSRAWGFFERAGRMPADDELAAALARVGFERVHLDVDEQTVRFADAGVELNFNSIGKGYALDRAAEALLTGGVGDFLMHGGRSSVLAFGSPDGNSDAGWLIGLPHPLRDGQHVGHVRVCDRGLGTSGQATQFFEHAGRRYGHVIDPRSGRPAEGVFTATALAPTAAEADALATAFTILGPGGTAEYCAQHPDAAAIVICPGTAADQFDVHTFNLGPADWTRTAD